MTVAFDTLKYAETLKAAGVPDPQAKAQAQALAEALKEGTAPLATQQDILLVKQDVLLVKQDIAGLRQEMNARLADLKVDLLKWTLSALALQGGLIVALLKLL